MPRGRQTPTAVQQLVEEHLAAFTAAIEHGNVERRALIASHLVEACGPVETTDALLSLTGRCRAENVALKSHLEEKNELLQSLLAEPRRIDRVLGLIREQADGRESVWAVLKGPPYQAAQLGPGVVPEEVCPEDPNEPVWVWLIKGSEESLVVAGTIDPPVLLEAIVENEMVFQGFVETGDSADEE